MSSLLLVEKLPADRNPAQVYIASLADGSKRTMKKSLDVIAGMLIGAEDALLVNWSSLRFQHTSAIRAKLAEEYKPSAANKMLSAMRGTLKAAWQLGQIPGDDYHLAVSVENIKSETLPGGRALSLSEISALIHVCKEDQSPAGVRDAAIIALMYMAGPRRSEVVNLNLDNFNPETGEVTIIRGKGNKDRMNYVLNGGAEAMRAWLDVRGDDPGPLFVPITKDGQIEIRRMSSQAIFNILRKRASQANLQDFSPHDIRRTFITHLLDAGADLVTVQRLAGHKNPSTTARYDRRGEEAKRNATSLLHIPYGR